MASDSNQLGSAEGGAGREAFSDILEQWSMTAGTKTVGDLGDVLAEKSFAVTVLFLMMLPALPLPTGGISHVFEAITVVVAGQMVLGRRSLWLPQRWQRRPLGAATIDKAVPFIVRRTRWLEQFARPRGTWVFRDRVPRAFIGLLIVVLAVAAALSPPFSGLDTIPSMGAVIIALSIIFEDVVVLVVGVVVGAFGVSISVALGAAVVRLVQGIF